MLATQRWRAVGSDSELRKRVMVQNADVYDLAWAPGGGLLAAASVNHVTCVWDVERRSMLGQWREHTHFVQGVAWDPHGSLVATQSSDRTVRFYGPKETDRAALEKKRKEAAKKGLPKPAPPLPGFASSGAAGVEALVGGMKCVRTLKLLAEPSAASAEPGNADATRAANDAASAYADVLAAAEAEAATAAAAAAAAAGDGVAVEGSLSGAARAPARPNLFLDETVPSFFRRLEWTPDGAFLIAPTGVFLDPHDPAVKREHLVLFFVSRCGDGCFGGGSCSLACGHHWGWSDASLCTTPHVHALEL